MVGLSSAGQLQFSAGSEASFLMAVKSSSFFEGTRFVSKVATGTAPVTAASTTLCANLNADLLDGKHVSELLTEVGAGRSARSLKITVGGNSIEYNTPFALRTDLGNYISSIQDGGTTGNVITDIRQEGGNLVITRGTVSGGSSAPAAHTHDAADITSGKLALARIPTGTTGSTVALGNHTHSGYALSNHTHSGYAAASHTHNYLPTTISSTAGITLTGSVNNPCLWMYNSKFPTGYGMQMLTNDGLFIGSYAKGGIQIDASGNVYACGPSLGNKKKLN